LAGIEIWTPRIRTDSHHAKIYENGKCPSTDIVNGTILCSKLFLLFLWLWLAAFELLYQLVVLLPFLLVIVEYLLEWLLLIASVQLVMYA
jgi:hypothetical protein